MPAASKVDACNAVAAWAGQYCKCRFELDDKELEEEEVDSLGSVSPMSSQAENGKELEEELALWQGCASMEIPVGGIAMRIMTRRQGCRYPGSCSSR